MKVVLAEFALILNFLHLCYGKPLSEEENIIAHFGKLSDFKDVLIPSKQNLSGATIIRPYDFNLSNDGSGNYSYHFSFPKNIERYEVGELKNAGTDNEIQVMRGQYTDTYLSADRSHIIRTTIGYIADENGYQPFLINVNVEPLTIVEGGPKPPPSRPISAPSLPVPGAPPGTNKDISSAALGSLIGGNNIG